MRKSGITWRTRCYKVKYARNRENYLFLTFSNMAGNTPTSAIPQSLETPKNINVSKVSAAVTAVILAFHLQLANAQTAVAMNTASGTLSSTSASTAGDKKNGWQILRKADGSIDFWGWLSGKTPEEIKKMVKWLTDSEYDSYLEWKTNKNNQKVATGQKLDATNEQKIATIWSGNQDLQKLDSTNEQKVATISAYEIIDQYQKVLLAWWYLKPDDKVTLRRALDTPGIDWNLKEKLKQYTL